MSQWNFFSDEDGKDLDQELMAMLDMARGKAGIPFVITCGMRTPEQNAALKNSVSDSAHLTGHAVDLACTESEQRFKMVTALLDAGFTRIGIYAAHLHADNDLTKSQGVMWYVAGA